MDIVTHELEVFCKRWLHKANVYRYPRPALPYSRLGATPDKLTRLSTPDYLASSFDRFTSLYVAFNRVYTEVGKMLVARGRVDPPSRGMYAPLPDKASATIHVVDYYGEDNLRNEILQNRACQKGVDNLVQLIQEGRFYLHEDYKTGKPNLRKDKKLAQMAEKYDPKAVLELIYQARCNLFHGAKAFEERQRVLLDNMSTILEFVTSRILGKLVEDLRRRR